MKNKNDDIYSRIQELCVSRGIKVTALCLEITKSKGNLATWKKGSIRSDHLCNIADYFDCSVDFLLGRTDNPIVNTLNEEETSTILEYADFLKHKNNNKGAFVAASGGNINIPERKVETPPEARKIIDEMQDEDEEE